jgi:ribosomal protein S18 acetylase RimI-like enzyme
MSIADQVEIRVATPSDAAAFSKFIERLYRETFEADNTIENMDAYLASAFSEEKQLAEILDPLRSVTLAFAKSEIVGCAQLSIREPDAEISIPTPIELLRLYVDFRFHGTGLAQRLIEDSFEISRKKGFKSIWLGVWEHNLRALKFYRKLGFEEAGSHVFHMGTDPQRDLILIRPL